MGYKAGMTHVVRDLDRPGSSACFSIELYDEHNLTLYSCLLSQFHLRQRITIDSIAPLNLLRDAQA